MSATPVQAAPSSSTQKQAVDKAKAAFARLPGGETLFQQCIESKEPVYEIVESLYQKCGVHKRKKFTRLLTGFQRYTSSSFVHYLEHRDDQAIQYLLEALAIEDELLGPRQEVPQQTRHILSDCYFNRGQYEQALQVNTKLLRDGFGLDTLETGSNQSTGRGTFGEMSIYQDDFILRHLRRIIQHFHDSREGMCSYDIKIKRLEMRAHFQRGEVMDALRMPEQAITWWQKCLDLGFQVPEASRDPNIIEQMLEACNNIGFVHFQENQFHKIIAQIQQTHKLRKQYRGTLSDDYEARYKLFRSYALNINAGTLGISFQSARDALQESVSSGCEALGADFCAGRINEWCRVAMFQLNTIEKGEGWSGSPTEVIAIYSRFLDVYEKFHGKETLKTLHVNPNLFVGYYSLGRLYNKAERDLDAIEAWKMCLHICENLWTSPPELLVFKYCVHAWNSLSWSNKYLGRYLESSRAARTAYNLAGDYPELHKHNSVSIEDLQENLVEACGQLWEYGPIFAPHNSSLRVCSAYEASLDEDFGSDAFSDEDDSENGDAESGDSNSGESYDDTNLEITPAMALADWIKERREAMEIGGKSWDDYFLPHERNDIGTLATRSSEKEKYRSVDALLLLGYQPDLGDTNSLRPQQ